LKISHSILLHQPISDETQSIYNSFNSSIENDLKGSRNISYLNKKKKLPLALQVFFAQIESIFEKKPEYLSVITSNSGTIQQEEHLDYFDLQGSWLSDDDYIPLVGFLALEDHVSIIINGNLVILPKSSLCILRGDIYHAGARWKDCKGARLHFHVATETHPANPDKMDIILISRKFLTCCHLIPL